jgi:hypothetical protein
MCELLAVQNLLYVTFTTIKRTAPVFNRGFFALYEFSDNYVKLGNLNFRIKTKIEIFQMLCNSLLPDSITLSCTLFSMPIIPQFFLLSIYSRKPVTYSTVILGFYCITLEICFSDFIQTADAEHIRGTECDQKILSKKESKGQVGQEFQIQITSHIPDSDSCCNSGSYPIQERIRV